MSEQYDVAGATEGGEGAEGSERVGETSSTCGGGRAGKKRKKRSGGPRRWEHQDKVEKKGGTGSQKDASR